MTRRAVLSLCLVLFSIVIERRNGLDYFRVNQVKRRLAHGSRGAGTLGGLIEILLRALARPHACNRDNREREDNSF